MNLLDRLIFGQLNDHHTCIKKDTETSTCNYGDGSMIDGKQEEI